ncbi:MAG: tetratricopeptide repeat protein [Leptospiraceae bacterium]|nr:tetratricopeptide repeat protein [Leptospiraceae bacterium]MDW7975203.1 tetratricopeptide repeat protein [Leptospiraceae bacterium]
MNIVGIVVGILSVLALSIFIYFFSLRKDVVEKALSLAREGNYLDARALIRSKLERDPENPKYHYTMALIYEMEGDEENAIQHYEQLYKIRKTVPNLSFFEIINKVADFYYRRENYVETVKYYEESLRFNKNNIEALARLAFLYAGQEMFERADMLFKRLISLVPKQTEFLLGRGIVCSILNKKESIELFEEVIALDPNHTLALLFLGIELYRRKIYDDTIITKLEDHLSQIEQIETRYLFYKLLMGFYFKKRNYNQALKHAGMALQIVLKEGFLKEEYYIRIAYACIAILGGDLDNAHENLFILESRDLNDQTVSKLADYRLIVEEGTIKAGDVSPSGFDFMNFANSWLDKLFSLDFIYNISGLKMGIKLDLSQTGEFMKDALQRTEESSIDVDGIINSFISLPRNQFLEKCNRLISYFGYEVIKALPNEDNEGYDCLAQNFEGKKALFKIRQWKNQTISDIFIRNFQNKINELNANEGYIISGAKLSSGGERVLQNLRKIKVIGREELANILTRI